MDKQEAIELLECEVEDNNYSDYHMAIRTAIDALKAIEHKTGHWIDDGDWMFCSKCGIRARKETLFRISLVGKSTPNYCPSCGIDMRGETE